MAENTVFFLILFLSSSFTVSSNKDTADGADAEVHCVYSQSCVVPCVFEPGPDPVITWLKAPGDVPVLSVHIDQVQYQAEEYKLRSALSVEELAKGNASLLLQDVQVPDEGRYVCLANTETSSKTSFVKLKVFVNNIDANLEKQDNELILWSEGIYPKPEVTWSCLPSFTKMEGRTMFFQRDDRLYDVYSSVPFPRDDKACLCVISTAHSVRVASFINTGKLLRVHEAILPCSAPSKSHIKSLIWKFNYQTVIYNRTGLDRVYNESWMPFVDGITDSHSLVLHNLSSEHEGVYSCHITTTDSWTSVIIIKMEILWMPLIYILFAWAILAACTHKR